VAQPFHAPKGPVRRDQRPGSSADGDGRQHTVEGSEILRLVEEVEARPQVVGVDHEQRSQKLRIGRGDTRRIGPTSAPGPDMGELLDDFDSGRRREDPITGCFDHGPARIP